MDDLAQQQLIQLIARYGQSVCDDVQRCEALLRDYYGGQKKEVSLLVNALKEQVPKEIISSAGKMPPAVLHTRLVRKLEDNLCMTASAAQWAVETWSKALGVEIAGEQDSAPSRTQYEPAVLRFREEDKTQVVPGREIPTPPVQKAEATKQPRSRKGLWLGAIGAGVLLMALGYGFNYQQGWQKMQLVLAEARTLQTKGKFQACVDRSEAVVGFPDLYQQAQSVASQCQLSLARQLAAAAKISQGIAELKKINAVDRQNYQVAQELLSSWSQGRWIKIENRCSHPIEVMLRYSQPENQIAKTDGWWQLTPEQNAYLTDNNSRIKILDPIFYYARSTDNSEWEWAGKETATLNGKDYKMRSLQPELDQDGNYTYYLTCNTPN